MNPGEALNTDEQDDFYLGYQPSLDGLRGISILVVMGFNGHLSFLRGGFLGVDVFFVLSGSLPALFIVMWACVVYA